MWGSTSQHIGQQNVKNRLQKSTGSPPPDIFKNKHLSSKTEQRSVQSWDNKMWFSVVSDVWIPTQALEMQIHRCPMGPGIQAAVQEFWPLYAEWLLPAHWKFVLFPWPGCFPHHSHLLLQLSQPHHSTHRHGCAIPGGNQLCQHGKSSSSSEKTEGWMFAKPRASSRPLYDVKTTPNTPQCPLTTCRMPTHDQQVQNELGPLQVSPSSYMTWRCSLLTSPNLRRTWELQNSQLQVRWW